MPSGPPPMGPMTSPMPHSMGPGGIGPQQRPGGVPMPQPRPQMPMGGQPQVPMPQARPQGMPMPQPRPQGGQPPAPPPVQPAPTAQAATEVPGAENTATPTQDTQQLPEVTVRPPQGQPQGQTQGAPAPIPAPAPNTGFPQFGGQQQQQGQGGGQQQGQGGGGMQQAAKALAPQPVPPLPPMRPLPPMQQRDRTVQQRPAPAPRAQEPQQVTAPEMAQRVRAQNPAIGHEGLLQHLNANRDQLDQHGQQQLDQINRAYQRERMGLPPEPAKGYPERLQRADTYRPGEGGYIGPRFPSPGEAERTLMLQQLTREQGQRAGRRPEPERQAAPQPPQPQAMQMPAKPPPRQAPSHGPSYGAPVKPSESRAMGLPAPRGRRDQATAARAPQRQAAPQASRAEVVASELDQLNSNSAKQGYVKPGTVVRGESGEAYRWSGAKRGWEHVETSAPEGFTREETPQRGGRGRQGRQPSGRGRQVNPFAAAARALKPRAMRAPRLTVRRMPMRRFHTY